jgi:hypothetical protein
VTYWHTCVGCKAKGGDCEHLEAMKKAIRLMGITSVKHVCNARVPMFAPGEQVLVNVFRYVDDHGEDDYEAIYGWFRGTFIQQKGTKGICFIKPGTVRDGCNHEGADEEDKFKPKNDGVGYVKSLLSRIKRIEGEELANVEECRFCGCRAHLTGICGHTTEAQCQPSQCLFKQINNSECGS